MNTIMTIDVYSTGYGGWAFDDPSVGLKREPFVVGADLMFERMAKALGGAKLVRVHFSESKIPDSNVVLYRKDTIEPPNLDGCYIASSKFFDFPFQIMSIWLCPATLKYFPDYPKKIYLSVSKLK